MKISVISDIHLGFGYNTERYEDAFNAFEEALQKSLDCDIIILGGDIFDSRVPKIEVLTRGMELLIKPLLKDSKIEIKGLNKDISELPRIRNGLPVIAIYGNHDRRVKGLLNPVEALEKSGFLTLLHCNGVILENGEEKISIQGLSGIPDQYAEGVLSEWGPKPIEGCFNIFLTHQNISPFVYAPNMLPLEKLPKGFDLYINGHIHDHKKTEYEGKPLIIPGSLLPTQINKDLCHSGFCKLEIKNNKLEKADFLELDSQRKIYYLELNNPSLNDIEESINNILKHKHDIKPIIRIKLEGRHLPLKQIISGFEEKAMISFKTSLKSDEIDAKSLQERSESVAEISRSLLSENLDRFKLDKKAFEDIFELLNNKKIKEAEALLDKIVA